jgi:t-SNARE complex subunit (syntaxin)
MELANRHMHDSFTEALLLENHEARHRIASSVEQVNQIFRDVASISRDQGKSLDRLDLEMQEAEETTKHLAVQLDTTARRSTRSCCEHLAVVLVVVVAVLILLLLLKVLV